MLPRVENLLPWPYDNSKSMDYFFPWPLQQHKLICLWLLLGHMCFTWLRTYVMILFNWLILWQNELYLYLGRFMMCLNTSKNQVSRSSVETFKSVQENKLIVQIHWSSIATSIELKKAIQSLVCSIASRHFLSVEV